MSFRLIIITAAALMALTIGQRSAYAYPFTGKQLSEVEVICEDATLKRDALAYFQYRLGTNVTADRVSQAMAALYQVGNIRNIRVFYEDETDGSVRLIFRIEEKLRISDITFSGNNYMKRSELIEAMQLRKGSIVNRIDLPTYTKRLEAFYQTSGFPQVKVSMSRNIDDAPNAYRIESKIDEGEPYKLSTFSITGALGAQMEEDLVDQLDLQEGEPINLKRVRDRLIRIQTRWIKKGYYQFNFNPPQLKPEPDSTKASMVISISPGPHISVRFIGKRYFFLDRDSLLKKTIGLAQEKQFSAGFLKAASDKLIEFYKDEGFPFPKVDYREAISDDGKRRTIFFIIEQGPRTKIQSIRYVGASRKLARDLEDYLLEINPEIEIGNPYVRSKLRFALGDLETKLLSEGYLDALVEGSNENFTDQQRKVDIDVGLKAGKRYRINKFDIHAANIFSRKKVLRILDIDEGDPLRLALLQDALLRLQSECQALGYRFCNASQAVENTEDALKRNVRINIDPGPKVRVGRILVRGNRITDEKVIRRELTFKQGDDYSLEERDTSQTRLRRLGFFRSAVIEELGFFPDRNEMDLVVKLVEKKQHDVTFRVGFGTDEGVRGGVDFRYSNIAGTGRNALIGSQISHEIPGEILEYRVSASYIEPWLLGTPVDGRLNVVNERSEELFGNLDLTSTLAALDYHFTRHLRNVFGWKLEFRNPFDLEVEVTDPLDTIRRRFGSLGTQLVLDWRDNPFIPRTGYLGHIFLDVYDTLFLSEEEFYQVFTRNSVYIPIYRQVKFAVSVRVGFSGTYGVTSASGTTAIPVEKRFRLGGSQTLRGFGQDCVGGLDEGEPANCDNIRATGGNSVFNYLAEVIVPIQKGFEFVVFTDGGEAYESNSDFDPLNIRNTAGLGLRYQTPVGPLRLDYGFILDRRDGESIGALHFAVGNL